MSLPLCFNAPTHSPQHRREPDGDDPQTTKIAGRAEGSWYYLTKAMKMLVAVHWQAGR